MCLQQGCGYRIIWATQRFHQLIHNMLNDFFKSVLRCLTSMIIVNKQDFLPKKEDIYSIINAPNQCGRVSFSYKKCINKLLTNNFIDKIQRLKNLACIMLIFLQ
jgi:hypothetical protein